MSRSCKMVRLTLGRTMLEFLPVLCLLLWVLFLFQPQLSMPRFDIVLRRHGFHPLLIANHLARPPRWGRRKRINRGLKTDAPSPQRAFHPHPTHTSATTFDFYQSWVNFSIRHSPPPSPVDRTDTPPFLLDTTSYLLHGTVRPPYFTPHLPHHN